MVRTSILALVFLVGCGQAVEERASAELALGDEAYTLEISPEVAASVDAPFIRREVEAAIALYRREVAAPSAPIAVVVDAPDCLRTGYDMPSRKVVFCKSEATPRSGTASADVIHHEMFHALLCQTKPGWCDDTTSSDTARVAMHEGLADYFSYALAPDDAFGEGFYRDKPIVRRYRVPLCYSLVGGGHEKGNAIVSELIDRGQGLTEIARLVAGPDLTLEALFGAAPADSCLGPAAPAVVSTVTGYPASTLERYRIRPDAPLTVRFDRDAAFQERYPNLTVRWEPSPPRFTITSLDTTSFTVAATGTSGFDKVTALYVVDDAVVGGKNFYFQVARPE